ncbi:MAG: hypothetical protein RL499_501, partial [Actinomycetota bacterium]
VESSGSAAPSSAHVRSMRGCGPLTASTVGVGVGATDAAVGLATGVGAVVEHPASKR